MNNEFNYILVFSGHQICDNNRHTTPKYINFLCQLVNFYCKIRHRTQHKIVLYLIIIIIFILICLQNLCKYNAKYFSILYIILYRGKFKLGKLSLLKSHHNFRTVIYALPVFVKFMIVCRNFCVI